MNGRLPGSLAEFGLIFIFILGFATAAAFGIGIVLTAVNYLLSESAWQALTGGAPWAIAGGVIGFTLGVYWMEGEIENDG